MNCGATLRIRPEIFRFAQFALTGVLIFENTSALDRSDKVQKNLFTILLVSFAAAALSEDFKTLNGKEYNDATVTRVEPDGIVLRTKSGITKVYFVELTKDVQERFHYVPEKAGAYAAEQAANYAAYQKQQEEARRQRDDADAKNKGGSSPTRSG